MQTINANAKIRFYFQVFSVLLSDEVEYWLGSRFARSFFLIDGFLSAISKYF